MNPVLVEPVLFWRRLSRITHHYKCKRHDALGELAVLGKPSYLLLHRVHPGPHRSQSKCVSGNKQVLCGRGAVLHPESRGDNIPGIAACLLYTSDAADEE